MAGSFRDTELSGWSARADSYDRLFTPITNQAIPRILATLADIRAKRVLDVCCGSGRLTAVLANAGADAEGLDFAPPMVAKASANFPALRFRQGDADNLPYDSNSFDHVVCCYGVMHLPNPDQAIAEAHRILKPGGKYVFTQWAKDDELMTIVTSAVAEHGTLSIDLPAAPPPLRFSDPDECRRVLDTTGFDKIAVERLDIAWTSNRPEALLELINGGAVRMAMVIQAQRPESRTKIEDAITRAARARTTGNTTVVRRPTVMAVGEKAAARA